MIEEGSQNLIRTFVEAVAYAHKVAGGRVSPEVVAMKASEMYMQMMIAHVHTAVIKEMGPGIRLDFASFIQATKK